MNQKSGGRRKEKGERRKEKGFFFPSILLKFSRLAFYVLLLALPFAYAVTYRVDPANGPETLATEVQEAFAAWIALSDKVEANETQENPESVFQYGASERFGPDTLSLTVQRQQAGRSLIFLISPNAENRRRILLHETGIAIGLEPQIPGTPLPTLPGTTPAPTPSEGVPSENAPAEEGQSETFETTPLPEAPTTPESTPAPTDTQSTEEAPAPTEEQTTTEEQKPEQQSTPETQTAPESTSEQPTDTQGETSDSTTTDTSTDSSEPSAEETPEQPSGEGSAEEQATDEQAPETPAASLTPNSVMNPSIAPDDSVELGDFERQLLERLELFVSEDINRDGVVNFYDLVALAQAFGRSGVNDPADINRDGLIDQRDVEALRSAYTFSDPSETAPGSSPTDATEATDGTTPPEGTAPEGTPPPEQTPPDGTPPDDLPPPNDGSSPDDGSGE